jgi:hypothetical protein
MQNNIYHQMEELDQNIEKGDLVMFLGDNTELCPLGVNFPMWLKYGKIYTVGDTEKFHRHILLTEPGKYYYRSNWWVREKVVIKVKNYKDI